MVESILTHLEEKFFCGPTWATERMTFWERLRFYRDTALWPGLYSEAVTEMYMENEIKGELDHGKEFCAAQKSRRAVEAGLHITGPGPEQEKEIVSDCGSVEPGVNAAEEY